MNQGEVAVVGKDFEANGAPCPTQGLGEGFAMARRYDAIFGAVNERKGRCPQRFRKGVGGCIGRRRRFRQPPKELGRGHLARIITQGVGRQIGNGRETQGQLRRRKGIGPMACEPQRQVSPGRMAKHGEALKIEALGEGREG